MKEQSSPKNTNIRTLSRRRFVGSAAATAAFSIVPRHVLGGPRHVAPSEKLNIAGIGVGGRGADDLRGVESENIVALCDVDWRSAAGTFRRYPDAKQYRDFREMLDEEGDAIDAVVVATPDHIHAVASMAAIKRGKHVWLWDGAIGPVREVHVWSDRPTHQGKLPLWWAQGIERPKDTPPVPEHLDWDLWLGPAPYRPYHPAYAPFRWRGWWDFGSGGLGDMGIHNLAPVFTALKLGAPTSVHASSTAVYEETLPLACTVHYEFPARGDMPAVTLHWYDGGLIAARPPELEDSRELPREDGLIFVGDRGKMLVTGWGGNSPRLIPEAKMKAYKLPPKSLPRSIGHYAEWIKACKEGTPTESSFAFAGPMTEAVLLGTVAVRAGGRKLLWDSERMKVTNSSQANSYLHYRYRTSWTL